MFIWYKCREPAINFNIESTKKLQCSVILFFVRKRAQMWRTFAANSTLHVLTFDSMIKSYRPQMTRNDHWSLTLDHWNFPIDHRPLAFFYVATQKYTRDSATSFYLYSSWPLIQRMFYFRTGFFDSIAYFLPARWDTFQRQQAISLKGRSTSNDPKSQEMT